MQHLHHMFMSTDLVKANKAFSSVRHITRALGLPTYAQWARSTVLHHFPSLRTTKTYQMSENLQGWKGPQIDCLIRVQFRNSPGRPTNILPPCGDSQGYKGLIRVTWSRSTPRTQVTEFLEKGRWPFSGGGSVSTSPWSSTYNANSSGYLLWRMFILPFSYYQ